jgi:Co/Zn/Cd efflux system component
MGAVGFLALAANIGVAVLLYRHRQGDSNRRSVWLCTRNDAIGNLTVILAASGVFASGTAWPDLIVALVMATLALSSCYRVVAQAIGEIRGVARLGPAE